MATKARPKVHKESFPAQNVGFTDSSIAWRTHAPDPVDAYVRCIILASQGEPTRE